MADDAIECQLELGGKILDEDQMLVSAARDDTETAGRLYDKYYSQILGYIYHCTLDSTVAEDLTSNVFLAALRHLGQYRWRQILFRAWLFRVATNEVRMYWRRKKRIKTISIQLDDEYTGTTTADSIESAEKYSLLHKALLELKIKYRTVIILRYFEGKAIADICEITGKKEGTVKAQLHRGLAKLQDILVQRGMLTE